MSDAIRKVKLDDLTMEARCAGYAQDVKDATMWAAGYVRRRHNSQINSLCEMCKSLGVDGVDYTYWNRIFNGIYFRKNEAGKTVGSAENFLKTIEALRKMDQNQARAGLPPFIETSNWRLIQHYIDQKRWPGRINKFGGIIGHTGTQKTACTRHYAEQNNHGKVVSMEAPVKPRMADFITGLARCYGIPPTAKTPIKKSRITDSISDSKTIIIENVQRLYSEKDGDQQEIFSTLQKIQDETGCAVIMTYTPSFARILASGADSGYFEQFIGRMGGLRKALVLPKFATTEDVQLIANAFGFQDVEEHLPYLTAISREQGLIRVLFDDLQDGKQLAEADSAKFSVDYLLAVRNEDKRMANKLVEENLNGKSA